MGARTHPAREHKQKAEHHQNRKTKNNPGTSLPVVPGFFGICLAFFFGFSFRYRALVFRVPDTCSAWIAFALLVVGVPETKNRALSSASKTLVVPGFRSLADAHEGLADAHDARLAGGVRGAENVVNTVCFACCAKNCSKTPRYGCRVCTQRQTSEKACFLEKTLFSSCFGRVFRDFRPPPPSR